MTAREEAIFLMHDRSSASQALGTFLQQLKLRAQEHPDKLEPIVSIVALVSVVHVATIAGTFDSAATQHPLVYGMAAAMSKMFMQRVSEAGHHSICSVFWGCGRLKFRPGDVQPGCCDELGQTVIVMQTSASLKGVGTVLWACSVLGLNPQDGTLLEHLMQTVQQRLASHDVTSKEHMPSIGTIMGSFVFLRLHIEPPLAELMITRVYEGLLLGAGEITGLRLVLWACASLGYLPAPHMLHCFKDSYAASKNHSAANLVQCDSSAVWSLAVLGVLDMEFFKMVILRCPRQLLRDADAQQLH